MVVKTFLSQHKNEVLLICLSSFFCLLLLAFRMAYSGSKGYLFLTWNLFLAGLPLVISYFLVSSPVFGKRRLLLVILILFWILFFPNAPYILTDLMHLKLPSKMPQWFDLILIFSFAWTGLLFGFISLWNLEILFQRYFPGKLIPVISVFILFLGSFGVYLGRYLRWNSWDLVLNPYTLLHHIADRVSHPAHHPHTWGMTLFMGVLLNVLYWSLKLIKSESNVASNKPNLSYH